MINEFCNLAQVNKTKHQNHVGYNLIKNAVKDKLLKAKHLFWISLSQEFQPFLTSYQADRPLLPFLSSDLKCLLRVVMGNFVKASVMANAASYLKLADVDIADPKNLKSGKSLDIGMATRRELTQLSKDSKVSPLEELRHNANYFLRAPLKQFYK